MEQTKKMVAQTFANPEKLLAKTNITGIDTLVWHVAAHEVGHAVYGMSNMIDKIGPETSTMLEEPRADLTAVFTMRLLLKAKKLTPDEFRRQFMIMACDACRYFA